jgi:hypothetical protein
MNGDGKKEIVVAEGGALKLFTYDGKLIWHTYKWWNVGKNHSW